ncbi:hypothetical protein TRFO_04908 [Tritrichomonas foetus]|uniref:Uncharacterized protein n=1 Tax=Tritrichomonas foetus TaxID=1144522 RepID=A0A1J4KBF1_9EUKA|nr:hypothetical protein TRFO_04908 [Tritrichomonas foetus]|eukprot:OHT08298.1 hypothetical protein TRFO_04908 [Tritrichomonas foetus]
MSGVLSPKNLGMNFAYVKVNDGRMGKYPSKKVLIPNSIGALKKNISVLFKLNDPIQSIYSEQNGPITNVNSIVKGETLVVSLTENSFKPLAVNTQKIRSKSPAMKPPSTRIASFGLSPNIVTIGPASPLLIDQAKLHFTVRDKSLLKRSHNFDRTTSDSADEEITIHKIRDAYDYGPEDNGDLLKALQSIFGDKEWLEKILPLFRLLSESDRLTLLDVERIMKEQSQYLAQLINAAIYGLLPTELPSQIEALGDIRQFCCQLIENHRFFSGDDVFYNFKVGIVGPRKSGKSVFLKILSRQIVNEFSNNGKLLHTFVCSFDMKQIVSSLSSFKDFYIEMVNIVCKALCAQRPILATLVNKEVKPFLLGVLEADPPSFKRHLLNHDLFKEFFNSVQEIGELLNLFWNDSQSLSQWYTNVTHLPALIAEAAGFDDVLFIIDHFDYSDVSVNARGRFKDANINVFVSEYFKFVISNHKYIISCEDEQKLYQILITLNDEINDYMPMEMISVSEIDADTATEASIAVSINGFDAPVIIQKEICGGIPAFIAHWNTLVHLTSEYEKIQKDTEESEESKLIAVAQMQLLLELCFRVYATETDEENAKEEKLVVTEVHKRNV